MSPDDYGQRLARAEERDEAILRELAEVRAQLARLEQRLWWLLAAVGGAGAAAGTAASQIAHAGVLPW